MIKELNISEIHSIQLEMMEHLHRICIKNNLHYFAAYGTLLGAIRHNGFIPWDDDVDVCLPREDYNKLLQLLEGDRHERYVLKSYKNYNDYRLPFAKLIDTRTKIDEYPSKDMGLGIFIDVFPLDFLPAKKSRRKIKILKNRFLFYFLNLKNRRSIPIKNARQLLEEVLLKPILSLVPYAILVKCIDEAMINVKDTGDLCSVSVHSTIAGKVYSYSKLFPLHEHVFESIMINVPNNWDDYLTETYGDYMTPPPVSERKLRHNTKAWIVKQ